jgi:hypothetical protein
MGGCNASPCALTVHAAHLSTHISKVTTGFLPMVQTVELRYQNLHLSDLAACRVRYVVMHFTAFASNFDMRQSCQFLDQR